MIASKGRVSKALIQSRRVMLVNSGLAAAAVTVRGSSAMPQMGQAPGPSRTICGCMGQVYSVRSFECDGLGCFQRHAALRARPGLGGEHLRMHRAGVLSGRCGLGRRPDRHQGRYRRNSLRAVILGQDSPRILSRSPGNRNTRYALRARPMPPPFAVAPSCRRRDRSLSELHLPRATPSVMVRVFGRALTILLLGELSYRFSGAPTALV